MSDWKKKKQAKKKELFVCSFASSYKEVKKLDREYREFVLQQKRHERYKKLHGIKEDPIEF